MKKQVIEIYNRTMKNCKFYEREGKKPELLNEIGTLRGVAYCVEALGECPHNDELFHFIEIQNELLQGVRL